LSITSRRSDLTLPCADNSGADSTADLAESKAKILYDHWVKAKYFTADLAGKGFLISYNSEVTITGFGALLQSLLQSLLQPQTIGIPIFLYLL
jgi:hypothetical protein